MSPGPDVLGARRPRRAGRPCGERYGGAALPVAPTSGSPDPAAAAVLPVEALSCPRCSNRERTMPMGVNAFLTDPEGVRRILRDLGLPALAPVLAAARPSP